jgi:hypothetical protein
MDKNQIVKAIGAIGRASQKLTKDIQLTAVGCIEHAVKHGDITLCDQLVDALGKAMRRASLRAWFENNGPMYLPKGKDKFAFDADRRGEWSQDREEALLALPWEEAKPEEPIVSVFDVSEAFDRFMKRVEAQVKDVNITVRNRELMELLGREAAAYHMEQAMKVRIDIPADAK